MGIDARMFFLTRRNLKKTDLITLSHRLYEAFYGEPFYLWEDEHILQEKTVFEQDGLDFNPPKGNQLIEVSLGSRFYGVGYERGPIHEHCMVAEWIEANVPDALVYYGGDSSGILATRFNKTAREEILNHWFKVGHTPYRKGFKLFDHACTCSRCSMEMNDVGGGGGDTFFSCGGCDEKAIVGKGNKVLKRWRGRPDFFEAHKNMETENATI